MFSIPALMLYRTAMFKSNDGSNEAIACVKVESGKIVALNGHDMMVCKSDLIEADQDYLIRLDSDIMKHLKHKNADNVILDGNRLVVRDRVKGERYIQPGDAVKDYLFPHYENILVKDSVDYHTEMESISIPLKSIELIQKAFGKTVTIRMTFTGEDSPIFYDVYDGQKLPEYRGIVMPSTLGASK